MALIGEATPQLAYTASKGAVLALTRELAIVHAREGMLECLRQQQRPGSKVLTRDPDTRIPLQLALSSTAQASGNLRIANGGLLAQNA